MTNINTSTIIRTVVLALALINQLLTATGHSVLPISDEQVTAVISTGFTIITALIAWWKNNSFTAAAIRADKFLAKIKEEKE